MSWGMLCSGLVTAKNMNYDYSRMTNVFMRKHELASLKKIFLFWYQNKNKSSASVEYKFISYQVLPSGKQWFPSNQHAQYALLMYAGCPK
jgi:hypothetical protein